MFCKNISILVFFKIKQHFDFEKSSHKWLQLPSCCLDIERYVWKICVEKCLTNSWSWIWEFSFDMNFNVYKTILFRLSIIQGYWNQIYGHSEISGCVRHPGLIKQIFLLLEATTELYSLSLWAVDICLIMAKFHLPLLKLTVILC